MATTVTQPIEPEKDEATGKFVHVYQPRDAEGQFIGKPYRFLYTDHMDLVRQLEEAKENGDRYIHEVKTGKRTVVGEPATPAPSYQPAAESTEEADRKRREEFRKSAEQEFGAPVDQVRADMKRARELEEYLVCNTWALNTPDYHACKDNAGKLGKYLKDKNLKVSPGNLDLAFEAIKDTLVPKPQEPPPTRTEARPHSTGIIPGQFAGTRQPTRTEKQPLTAERFRQIDLMSRDKWKRLERENPAEAKAFLAMKYRAQPQQ